MKEFDEYQKVARSSAIYPMNMPVIYPALGLAGETGEVLDKIKKIYRDNNMEFDKEHRTAIAKELGDVLWYLTNLAEDLGFNLSDVAQMNADKIESRKERNVIHGEGDDR